jgi:hypothetical protein
MFVFIQVHAVPLDTKLPAARAEWAVKLLLCQTARRPTDGGSCQLASISDSARWTHGGGQVALSSIDGLPEAYASEERAWIEPGIKIRIKSRSMSKSRSKIRTQSACSPPNEARSTGPDLAPDLDPTPSLDSYACSSYSPSSLTRSRQPVPRPPLRYRVVDGWDYIRATKG